MAKKQVKKKYVGPRFAVLGNVNDPIVQQSLPQLPREKFRAAKEMMDELNPREDTGVVGLQNVGSVSAPPVPAPPEPAIAQRPDAKEHQELFAKTIGCVGGVVGKDIDLPQQFRDYPPDSWSITATGPGLRVSITMSWSNSDGTKMVSDTLEEQGLSSITYRYVGGTWILKAGVSGGTPSLGVRPVSSADMLQRQRAASRNIMARITHGNITASKP